MSGRVVLERARMALADVGIDPERLWLGDDGRLISNRVAGDERVLFWRAARIARIGLDDGRLACLACTIAADCLGGGALQAFTLDACRAARPLVLDCGVGR